MLTALVFAYSAARAQSFEQYMIMRRQNHVFQSAGLQALDTLVGSRVFEVKGTVKGTFRVGPRSSMIVEGTDGTTVTIEADAEPDWLVGNETPARLLVRASRSAEAAPLQVVLVCAAREAEMAHLEAAEAERLRAAEAARQERLRKQKQSAQTADSIAVGYSGLYGEIGPHGSYHKNARTWLLPTSEVTPIYASFIKRQNPRLSNGEAVRIAEGIVGFSQRFGVDARLIMAMVMVESGFDPSAVSRSGAVGLGQLMPGTARWMGVSDSYDTIDNLHGTVQLIRKYLGDYKRQTGQDFESLVLTLAAYNAGDGAVRRHGGVPPYRETQAYIRHVIRLYYRLAGVGS